eukprot:5306633-Pyramimonas_sp.AAC.2
MVHKYAFYGSSCANNGKDALDTPDHKMVHNMVNNMVHNTVCRRRPPQDIGAAYTHMRTSEEDSVSDTPLADFNALAGVAGSAFPSALLSSDAVVGTTYRAREGGIFRRGHIPVAGTTYCAKGSGHIPVAGTAYRVREGGIFL